MRTIRTKADVETHSDGYRPGNPAVNVKVYKSVSSVKLPMCLGGTSAIGSDDITWHYTDPRFTHDWISENISDSEADSAFQLVCESGWESITEAAQEIFGSGVKCYSEGRCGGWAVVHGLPDIETWDAVMLAKWRKFAKAARAQADDIPYQMVDQFYHNQFEEWAESQQAEVNDREYDDKLIPMFNH